MKRKLRFEPIGAAAVAAVLVILPAALFAYEAKDPEVCRSIEGSAERLACYDAALAPEPAAPEPAPPEPAAAEPAPPEPAVAEAEPEVGPGTLTDDIGLETVKGREKEELLVQGYVVRCQKGRSGKFLFYFDNGQVWRQKDSKRMSWKDCDFEVTISKDVFGYIMTRNGEKRVFRVERLK